MTRGLIENTQFILVGIAVVSVGGAYIAYLVSQRRLRRRIHQELFGIREVRSDDEFYHRHFTPSDVSKDVVVKLLSIFREENHIELDSLDPDRDFVSPLSQIDFENFDDAFYRIEEEFGVEFGRPDGPVTTFRQIAIAVQSRSKQIRPENPGYKFAE